MITLDFAHLAPRDRRAWADTATPYATHCTLASGLADTHARLLWRWDPITCRLLVQTPPATWRPGRVPGRWTVEQKRAAIRVARGQRLRFRLYANPTVERDRREGIVDADGQRAWLCRKLAGAGEVLQVELSRQALLPQRQRGYDVIAVQFDGLLQVTDADALLARVARGVGRSRHLGMGLLSLARAN